MDSQTNPEKPTTSPKILIVDDDPSVREVLSVLLEEEGYTCDNASSAKVALEMIHCGYDLVISDLKMPEHDGLWLLQQLRKQDQDLAIIMLTGYGNTESAVDCLKCGAIDYLLKPPKITELVRAIERALSKRQAAQERRRYRQHLEDTVKAKTKELSNALAKIESAYNTTLLALVAALDAREHETGDHSLRVVRFCEMIAKRMGLSPEERIEIRKGALLHDIGKIGVPDRILLKPNPLNSEEWAEMRCHPNIGFNILKQIDFLKGPSEMVVAHHERFDGTGYPNRLRGMEIPIGARIFSIADTLDAITSDRPYRKAQSFQHARAEIQRCSGSQFDPEIVEYFLKIPAEEFELNRRQAASHEAIQEI